MIEVIDEHHLRVGDRTWFGQFWSDDYNIDSEHEWKLRQFIVRFESKWSVSIVWGYATYSDNHELPWGGPGYWFNESPERVEAAVLHADREKMQGDDPFAYIDAEQLNALLYHVSQLHTEDHFHSDRT